MEAIPTNDSPTDSGHDDVAGVMALQVGDRAHRVIARVLTAGLSHDRDTRTLDVVTTAADVMRGHPVSGNRQRAAVFEVATAAACYLHRFVLPEPWRFHDAEMSVVNGRVDVVWANTVTGEKLIDEVKSTVGRAGESALRDQIDRYVAAGVAMWGDAFVGVRVCAVSQPRRSRLHTPDRTYSVLLSKTSLAGSVA